MKKARNDAFLYEETTQKWTFEPPIQVNTQVANMAMLVNFPYHQHLTKQIKSSPDLDQLPFETSQFCGGLFFGSPPKDMKHLCWTIHDVAINHVDSPTELDLKLHG